MTKLTAYAAFLRGINVGGNKKVPMADLKKLLEKMGYANVRTILASGNVTFETKKMPNDKLASEIEKALHAKFGFEVGTLVRTIEEIQAIADADPFKGIKVTPDIHLYITFLSEKPKSKPTISKPLEKSVKITRNTPTEICTVLTRAEEINTLDMMDDLTKQCGKKITTRNWNTIEKILVKK